MLVWRCSLCPRSGHRRFLSDDVSVAKKLNYLKRLGLEKCCFSQDTHTEFAGALICRMKGIVHSHLPSITCIYAITSNSAIDG